MLHPHSVRYFPLRAGSFRGSSLLAVLVLTTLLVVTLGVVVQSTTFHQRAQLHLEKREQARNLAEGMLHRAVAELVNRESCGDPPGPSDSFRITSNDGLPGSGLLTFDPATARQWGIDCSLNRLDQTAPSPAPVCQDFVSAIPPNTALLLARGTCGEVQVRLLGLYRRPPFPKGIACTGQADLEGSIVRGLDAASHFDPDWSAVSPTHRIPSNVFSNSSADPGLRLGRGCLISGNAGSCGTVQLREDARVQGEVRSRAAAQEVPDLSLSDLQTRVQTMAGLQPLPAAGAVTGFCTSVGDYTRSGDLVLDGGVVSVQGDLLVTGALRGRGLVLVRGQATIQGGSSLSAQDQVALVAGGRIELAGRGRDYYFNGMLYSHQSILASNLTILGSLICQSTDSRQGGVRLQNVSLYQVPVSVTTRYGLPLVGTVGHDSFRFNLSRYEGDSRPEYYGSALYCEDFAFHPEDRILEVFWRPGEAEWRTYDRRTQLLKGVSRQPYDGSLAQLRSQFQYFLTLGTEPVGDSIGQLDRYVANLSAPVPPIQQVLDLNLNRILQSVEPSRMVVVREY
ncbi:hypothetical protein JST97_20785 [bacterium]|nr:hypothetical protein [bacterium]